MQTNTNLCWQIRDEISSLLQLHFIVVVKQVCPTSKGSRTERIPKLPACIQAKNGSSNNSKNSRFPCQFGNFWIRWTRARLTPWISDPIIHLHAKYSSTSSHPPNKGEIGASTITQRWVNNNFSGNRSSFRESHEYKQPHLCPLWKFKSTVRWRRHYLYCASGKVQVHGGGGAIKRNVSHF